MTYQFEIGATSTGMFPLSVLGIPDPEFDFAKFTGQVDLPDGETFGVGPPVAQWHWGFLPDGLRDVLKSFCPGHSATIYIRMPKDDVTNATFQAKITWPLRERKSNGNVLDLTLPFTFLVEQ